MKSLSMQANALRKVKLVIVRQAKAVARLSALPQVPTLPSWYIAIFFLGSATVARGIVTTVGWAHNAVLAVVYAACLLLALLKGEAIARNPRASAVIGSAGFLLAALTMGNTAVGIAAVAMLFLVAPLRGLSNRTADSSRPKPEPETVQNRIPRPVGGGAARERPEQISPPRPQNGKRGGATNLADSGSTPVPRAPGSAVVDGHDAPCPLSAMRSTGTNRSAYVGSSIITAPVFGPSRQLQAITCDRTVQPGALHVYRSRQPPRKGPGVHEPLFQNAHPGQVEASDRSYAPVPHGKTDRSGLNGTSWIG